MPRWSDTPHIIHDSQWFYSKYKDDDHAVTWNSNSPKKKKRESLILNLTHWILQGVRQF